MQQLEAHEMALHRVFNGDFDFRIPDYQRQYAWDVEQAIQLLRDLREALERDGEEPYFLGSLVLVRAEDGTKVDVIDGQQRLTTLTIMLAVLRDLAVDPDTAIALEAMIIEKGNPLLKRKPKPRLELREKDAPFFRDHVQNTGSLAGLLALKPDACRTDAQRTIVANAKALYDDLKTWSDKERKSLGEMLSARTFLVVVKTPDQASAHRIFSVMNARGLDLTPADIFKSRIIGKLDSEVYAAKWEDAEARLGRDKFAELFLHLRMIYVKERARTELLKEFPEQVLDMYFRDRDAEFVDDVLVPYAKAFAQIRTFGYSAGSGADKVNVWFRRLAQIDNNDWVPPALWALRHHWDDPVWLDRFFRALERLAASLFIRRIYTTPRLSRYSDLLRDLADGKGLDSPAFELDADERAGTRAQLDGDLYLVTKTRRYVLLRLDEVLTTGAGATYDHPVITVEHVLPQNPKGESRWRAEFTDADRGEWTHRLANLVLLNRAKNSQASNNDFDHKKVNYFLGKHGAANFTVTSQVLLHDRWTPEVLEERQRELVKALACEWNL